MKSDCFIISPPLQRLSLFFIFFCAAFSFNWSWAACQKAADATLSTRTENRMGIHSDTRGKTFEIERCRCVRFRNTIWLMLLKFFIKSYMRFWYDMNDIVCDIVYSTRANVKHMFDSITATFTHTGSSVQLFNSTDCYSMHDFPYSNWIQARRTLGLQFWVDEREKLAWQWQTSLQSSCPHGSPLTTWAATRPRWMSL